MNISYNWLKEYLDFDLEPEEVAAALTSIGLETGGVEEVQTIKGGLEGLVELLAGIPGRGGGTYPVQDVAEPGDGEGQGEQLRLGETGDEGEQEDQPAMSRALGWAKNWPPICAPTSSWVSPERVMRIPAEMAMMSEGIWETRPSPMVRMP